MMFTNNPFHLVTDFLPALVMQVYVIVMIVAVVIGTLFDLYHKQSATFFARRRAHAKAAAQRPLNSAKIAAVGAETLGKVVAASGEFCKLERRLSHVLMSYGFALYIITTAVMVFAYPTAPHTPVVLPILWCVGALLTFIGGVWFFFFLRVDVAHDGRSPFTLVRADLFIVTLLLSVALALIWQFVQTTFADLVASIILFGLYIFFTTLLFVSVPWSKFAHMFYKPAAAFQKSIEEMNGSSDLPRPADARILGE